MTETYVGTTNRLYAHGHGQSSKGNWWLFDEKRIHVSENKYRQTIVGIVPLVLGLGCINIFCIYIIY